MKCFSKSTAFCFLVYLQVAVIGGCIPADKSASVRIGSGPNLWFGQTSVIIGEGWDKEAGLTIEQVRAAGPAQMLQAFVAGDLDGMNNNVAAALLARDKGTEITVVTGTIEGDICLVARGALVLDAKHSGAVHALRTFRQRTGRKLKLVTNARGSLSELTTRGWLEQVWPNYLEEVDLTYAGDQAQLQQIFLTGSADVISAFTPLMELAQAKDSTVEVIVPPSEMGAPQAGGALIMRKSYVDENPNEVAKLRALYDRATEMMKLEPERAAGHIDRLLVRGLVPLSVLEAAIQNRSAYFTTDLSPMVPAWTAVRARMIGYGYIKSSVPEVRDLLWKGETSEASDQ